MKLIYLASPYTHKDKAIEAARFQLACLACGKLFNKGYAVYSPIVHWHCVHNLCQLKEGSVNVRFLDAERKDKSGFETFKAIDAEMIARADELWVLVTEGTYESKGIKAELAIARTQSKPTRCYRLEEDSVL